MKTNNQISRIYQKAILFLFGISITFSAFSSCNNKSTQLLPDDYQEMFIASERIYPYKINIYSVQVLESSVESLNFPNYPHACCDECISKEWVRLKFYQNEEYKKSIVRQIKRIKEYSENPELDGLADNIVSDKDNIFIGKCLKKYGSGKIIHFVEEYIYIFDLNSKLIYEFYNYEKYYSFEKLWPSF